MLAARSQVAHAVTARAQSDALAGLSEPSKLLERNGGAVDRKLVKQTVMTVVYGVTEIGARAQIGNRLRERGWSNDAEIFQVGARRGSGKGGDEHGGMRRDADATPLSHPPH